MSSDRTPAPPHPPHDSGHTSGAHADDDTPTADRRPTDDGPNDARRRHRTRPGGRRPARPDDTAPRPLRHRPRPCRGSSNSAVAAELQYSRTALVRATTRPRCTTMRLYASESAPASRSPRTASNSAGKPASTRTSGSPRTARADAAHRVVRVLGAQRRNARPAGRRPPAGRRAPPGSTRPAARRCPRRPAPRPRAAAVPGPCTGPRRVARRRRSRPAAGRPPPPRPPRAGRRSGRPPRRAAGPSPPHGPRVTPGRSPPAIAASRASRAGSVGVGVQVDGAAVLGGHLQDRLHVARRIGVQIGAAAHHGGAHLQRVPQHREPVGAGHAGQQPRHRHGRQLGEPAQRPPGLEHGLQRAQPLDVADAHVRAQRGRPVPELQQGGLGGPALDVLGVVRDRPLAVGRQRGVAVGVRLGRGRQQQIAAEVHACATRACRPPRGCRPCRPPRCARRPAVRPRSGRR